MGPAEAWTDEEIERLSAVTPAEADDAVALWRRSVPPALRGLLSTPGPGRGVE